MSATQTKAERILELFAALGEGATVTDVTAKAMADGVWSPAEDAAMLMRERQAAVRRVLNTIRDEDGLPEAQLVETEITRDEEGEIIKVTCAYQREFWTISTTRAWIRQRVAGIRHDAQPVIKMVRYGSDRWPRVNWSKEIVSLAGLV